MGTWASGTLLEALRGQEFTAILENDAVFHALLQSVPNRVLQIGLCGQVQKFDRAPKHFEVSFRGLWLKTSRLKLAAKSR